MRVETKMTAKNSKGTTKQKMGQQPLKARTNTLVDAQKVFADKRTDAGKPKVDQVKYVKTFESFEKGINEMLNISGDIYELLRDVDADCNNIDGAMKGVLQVFMNHMPSFTHRENMHYDLSLSANKCSLKTDKFISFGWYVKSVRNEDQSFDTSYIFHIIVFGNKDELVGSLVKAGWEVDTYKR